MSIFLGIEGKLIFLSLEILFQSVRYTELLFRPNPSKKHKNRSMNRRTINRISNQRIRPKKNKINQIC